MTYCLLCVQSVLSHRSDLPEKAKKPFKALTVLGSKRHRYACLGVRTKQAARHNGKERLRYATRILPLPPLLSIIYAQMVYAIHVASSRHSCALLWLADFSSSSTLPALCVDNSTLCVDNSLDTNSKSSPFRLLSRRARKAARPYCA